VASLLNPPVQYDLPAHHLPRQFTAMVRPLNGFHMASLLPLASGPYIFDQTVKPHFLLPSRGHLLHDSRIPTQLLLAEDDHIAGLFPIGRLHLPFHFPVEDVPIRRTARPTQFSEKGACPPLGRLTQAHHLTVQPAMGGKLSPVLLQRDEDPIQSQGKAESRNVSPSDLFHQPVISAAAAQGSRLGSPPLQNVFKGGLGI